MKKNYYILFFGLIFILSGNVKAQSSTSQQDLIAYPNPTKNSLFLKTINENVKIETVTFFSILGRPVATYKVNASSTKINLESLRYGKYLMRYTLSDNQTKVKQIIKQ